MTTPESRETLIRQPTVAAQTGLGRAYMYRLISQGQFPRPLKIGARASAWRQSQVDAWIAARVAAAAAEQSA